MKTILSKSSKSSFYLFYNSYLDIIIKLEHYGTKKLFEKLGNNYSQDCRIFDRHEMEMEMNGNTHLYQIKMYQIPCLIIDIPSPLPTSIISCYCDVSWYLLE